MSPKPLLLNAEQCTALIPHAGPMSLLAGVQHWDQEQILCLSDSHLLQPHPLASDGIKPAHLLEYAAQAMAVHGGLLANSPERDKAKNDSAESDRADNVSEKETKIGLLASVRKLKFGPLPLVFSGDSLHIQATVLLADDNGLLYRFAITDREKLLISGRAAVLFRPALQFQPISSPSPAR